MGTESVQGTLMLSGFNNVSNLVLWGGLKTIKLPMVISRYITLVEVGFLRHLGFGEAKAKVHSLSLLCGSSSGCCAEHHQRLTQPQVAIV